MENLVVFGVSAVALVVGLVQFAKKLGLKDNGALILAMVLGPALMVGYEFVKQFPSISPWVQAVITGLVVSLSASGLWDTAKYFLLAKNAALPPSEDGRQ